MSLAWGPWEGEAAGMTGTLTDADMARIARAEFSPLSPEQGLALFDVALSADEPVVAPVGRGAQ